MMRASPGLKPLKEMEGCPMPNQKTLCSFISVIAIVFFVSATIVDAQTANAKPKPVGSISGRVTIDGKAATGIPVAAVEGPTVNRQDAPARAFSDAEGNYQIKGLKAGEYQIWSMTPLFIADPGANYFTYPGAVKSVLLGVDEKVTGVDLKLIRGAVITGRVTNSDNKPVVDEQIKLQLLDTNGNPRFGAVHYSYDQMSLTDDRGIYRIFDLAPGRYRVSVGFDPSSDSAISPHRYDQAFYSDPNDRTKPGVVELAEGGEANNIDLRVGAAAATFSVSGRVIDTQTGVPIAKARVGFTMVPKDKNTPAPGIGVQTDDHGEFKYGGFSSGQYLVTTSSDPYGGNFYGDPVPLEIKDKDVTGLELRTVPGLTLSGHISADGLSTKELAGLLPKLSIIANGLAPGNNQIRIGGRSAIAPDGSFEIGGLRPGLVSIFMGSTQSVPFTRTFINRIEHDGGLLNQSFEMKTSLSGLNIVIDYGTGVIRGTVKLEGTDAPLTDSILAIICKREGGRDQTFTQVDARGHFEIRNLAPGPFELTLNFSSLTPRPRGIPPQKQIVNVTKGAETEVTFVVNLGPKPGGP
jgi:hypothetical protein